MVARINYRDLRRQIQLDGSQRAINFIREGLENKDFEPDDFSLKQLAQYTIEDGHEWVDQLQNGVHGSSGVGLMEAGGGGAAVSTATFSNITGQISYTAILDRYNDPNFIWPALCTTQSTPFSGEKIPGISDLGDQAGQVSEGKKYPLAGVGQDYIETPETIKKGFIVPVTKEAVFFDRTGLVLDRCRRVGTWAGFNKEKEVVDLATGQTNNYRRNGTAYNTYYASAGHGKVNQHTAVLTDWTDIEAAYLLFDGLTDWTTGEPILIMPDTLIVPSALIATANRIVSATQVRSGISNTTTSMLLGGNPLNFILGNLKVVSNQMVKARTSSTVKWFFGQPKRSFKYMENWGFTPEQAPANSEKAFEQDILYQFKISWRGVAAVVDPLFMTYSVGSG